MRGKPDGSGQQRSLGGGPPLRPDPAGPAPGGDQEGPAPGGGQGVPDARHARVSLLADPPSGEMPGSRDPGGLQAQWPVPPPAQRLSQPGPSFRDGTAWTRSNWLTRVRVLDGFDWPPDYYSSGMDLLYQRYVKYGTREEISGRVSEIQVNSGFSFPPPGANLAPGPLPGPGVCLGRSPPGGGRRVQSGPGEKLETGPAGGRIPSLHLGPVELLTGRHARGNIF